MSYSEYYLVLQMFSLKRYSSSHCMLMFFLLPENWTGTKLYLLVFFLIPNVRKMTLSINIVLNCLSLQVPSLVPVEGEFPVRTWAMVTVRAGCGRRRMLKATSPRNGESTGLSSKSLASTGTLTKM